MQVKYRCPDGCYTDATSAFDLPLKDQCRKTRETRRCNTHPCPMWSEWQNWSSCTKSCGYEGKRSSSRLCLYGDELDCIRDQEGSLRIEDCPNRPCIAVYFFMCQSFFQAGQHGLCGKVVR